MREESKTACCETLGPVTVKGVPRYSVSYVYGPDGNRTSRIRSINGGAPQTDVYQYDEGDKLLSITRNGGAFRTFAYNGLGETTRIYNGTTSAAFTQFNWDNDGRALAMDLPGTSNGTTLRYNGFGTRVDRAIGLNIEV